MGDKEYEWSGLHSNGGSSTGGVIALDVPYATITTYFDNYGVGSGPYIGWQIANGYGSTNDWRGRFPIGSMVVPSAGSPPLNPAVVGPGGTLQAPLQGGSNSYQITQANLPAVGLRLLSKATQAQLNEGISPYFVYDTNGGGDNFSLKGDSDNSMGGGSGVGTILTENMGTGTVIQMMPAYQVIVWIAKIS